MNDVVRLLRRALPEVRACPTARGAAGRSTGSLHLVHAGPPLLLNGRGTSSDEMGMIQRQLFSRTAAAAPKTSPGGAVMATATAEEGPHILKGLLWGNPDPRMSTVCVRSSNSGAGFRRCLPGVDGGERRELLRTLSSMRAIWV